MILRCQSRSRLLKSHRSTALLKTMTCRGRRFRSKLLKWSSRVNRSSTCSFLKSLRRSQWSRTRRSRSISRSASPNRRGGVGASHSGTNREVVLDTPQELVQQCMMAQMTDVSTPQVGVVVDAPMPQGVEASPRWSRRLCPTSRRKVVSLPQSILQDSSFMLMIMEVVKIAKSFTQERVQDDTAQQTVDRCAHHLQESVAELVRTALRERAMCFLIVVRLFKCE